MELVTSKAASVTTSGTTTASVTVSPATDQPTPSKPFGGTYKLNIPFPDSEIESWTEELDFYAGVATIEL